jgi:hypothetical protein
VTALKLDTKLTQLEHQLIQKLHCHLTVEMKTKFTSDDFRMLGLDRFVVGDPSKAIGLLFWKIKQNGIAEDTGERTASIIPSNHGREIKVWKFLEVTA